MAETRVFDGAKPSGPGLPVYLAFAAGYVDGTTFALLFGLFVAQVTGSYVMLGAELMQPGPELALRILAIPTFAMGAVLATLIAARARREGHAGAAPVLTLESALMVGLLVSANAAPMVSPHATQTLVAGLFGIGAMGVQSAFVRLFEPGLPSSVVMTTNTTQCAIDATVVLLSGRIELPTLPVAAARRRLATTAPTLLAFFIGTVAGIVISRTVGLIGLVVPTAMLIGLAVASRRWPA
jgi:uncharacterized membrane protein YoaK (UPF0700 family)